MIPEPATTEDAVLGGRLVLRQPQRGHRVGHDAILLAAATDAQPDELAVDLGAGVGAAGLALAARVPKLAVVLVEVDAELARLADENIQINALGEQVRAVVLDVGARPSAFAAAGLQAGAATRVLMNPPFNDAWGNPSPDGARRLAHAASADTLAIWLRCAFRLLCRRGVLTLLWRADGLGRVLSGLADGFGAATVLPIYPRPDRPAIRVLVRAVKESRAPLCLLPGLVLCDPAGQSTPAATAILRGTATLSLAPS
ncbi:MAG TPA: methyltransferase [Xanthobacteraceae bacterium]|nr:methyltransferase [Xanthobacteraceae bacterium]